jgi:hypothetical protein
MTTNQMLMTLEASTSLLYETTRAIHEAGGTVTPYLVPIGLYDLPTLILKVILDGEVVWVGHTIAREIVE